MRFSYYSQENDPSGAPPLDVHAEIATALAAEAAIRAELAAQLPGSTSSNAMAAAAVTAAAAVDGNQASALGGSPAGETAANAAGNPAAAADVEAEVERRLRALGTERARLHGWQVRVCLYMVSPLRCSGQYVTARRLGGQYMC